MRALGCLLTVVLAAVLALSIVLGLLVILAWVTA